MNERELASGNVNAGKKPNPVTIVNRSGYFGFLLGLVRDKSPEERLSSLQKILDRIETVTPPQRI